MADKTVASLSSSTPTIDDLTISYDNADTSELKKTTWQLVRDLFKAYFDTIYQAVLISGTNIKTINSTSILGSGDIVISGGGSVATDTIWDAKGDLAVGTGANTASRLAVGTNGQILVADSAEATGVKWATASGTGDMLASTYDPANIAQQVAGLTATQTFSIGVKTFLSGMFALRNVANTFSGFFTNTNTADRTYTLQDSSDTLVGRATTDTLTNKSISLGTNTVTSTFAQLNTAITDADIARTDAANTFTGVQTMTSPSFTTPVLGTPSSGTLTNCNGLPVAGITASTSTALGVGSIELGNASDTTISRESAGQIAVEGVRARLKNPIVLSAASYTTDTGTSLNMDNLDMFIVTAQAGALLFNAPGGTLAQGRQLIIRIKDNGTARALTWNAVFRAMGTALPSTTVLSKTLYLGFIYSSTDTKWDLIASAQEA